MTVGLVLVVRTIRTAVADRVCGYAAAVVAGEAVHVASVARTAGLSGIRCGNGTTTVALQQLVDREVANFNSCERESNLIDRDPINTESDSCYLSF